MQKRSSNAFFIFVLIVFGLEMFGIAHTIKLYRGFLVPDENTLLHARDTGLTIEDKNGNQFFTFESPARKTFIPLKEIPLHTQQAVLASEDRDFYNHGALSFSGIIRAIIDDIKLKSLAYGGSTLSQQVVKNTMLSPEKSFSRKYTEMILAFKLEKQFSKSEILELYLNTAYFGQNAFGIESAAETYYGKHASELTIGESATLAALLPAPSDLTPAHGISQELTARKKSILVYMHEEQFLDDYGTFITRPDQNTGAPYFAILIRDQLTAYLGEEEVARGGFHVQTSLDPTLQTQVEQILLDNKNRLAGYNAHNAAVVVIDVATRQVRALVGNISWTDGKFGKVNMAITPRQPGSSFKPIVYATAFERNVITPETLLHDVPTTYKIDKNKYYTPKDYSLTYAGIVPAQFALANSLNIPAVEALHMTGGANVVAKARGMGIPLPDSAESALSLALGAFEVSPYNMTNAFATFADNGMYKSAVTMLSIKDKFGEEIATPIQEQRQAVAPDVTKTITSILSDENLRTHTFGSLLSFHQNVALKTGTSSDFKDGWTLGYSPTTAIGVWVGNSDNTPMFNAPGVYVASPIWKEVLDVAN